MTDPHQVVTGSELPSKRYAELIAMDLWRWPPCTLRSEPDHALG